MSNPRPTSTAERAAAALREQQRAEKRRSFAIVGAVVAVLVVIGGLTWYGISSSDTTGQVGGSGTPANTDGFAVVVGQASAPTTFTFYEDPQCPACRDFEAQTRDQVDGGIADGSARVEYRIVSFLDHASENNYSSRAANALFVVVDAAGPDVFKKFHDILYENQPAEGTAGPDNDQLIAWAVQAGASEDDVRSGIEDGAFDQFVVNATDQWSKDGFNSTPTVLINGKPATDPVNEVLQALQ
jgi:protein-disulfide isomerase